MTPEQRLNYAEQLKHNPLLDVLFEELRGELFDLFTSNPNEEHRNMIYNQAQALNVMINRFNQEFEKKEVVKTKIKEKEKNYGIT